jgi:hypothetical protein
LGPLKSKPQSLESETDKLPESCFFSNYLEFQKIDKILVPSDAEYIMGITNNNAEDSSPVTITTTITTATTDTITTTNNNNNNNAKQTNTMASSPQAN